MTFIDKTSKTGAVLLASTIATATFSGCGTSSSQPQAGASQSITLFVAANATDPVNDLIQTFQKEHPGVTISPNYAGTQILETQLEQGAPADFFLSADLTHIEKIKAEGLIDQYQAVSQTKPVIIVPKSNPAGVHDLQDLGTKPVKLLLGVEGVPVGQYARQIFTKANAVYGPGFSAQAMGHVVSMETNVKQILQKVAMGEADAGIVYATETSDLKDKVTLIPIPANLNVTATNYIAVPKKAPHATLGNDFMQFMLSPQGQSVFRKYGYTLGS